MQQKVVNGSLKYERIKWENLELMSKYVLCVLGSLSSNLVQFNVLQLHCKLSQRKNLSSLWANISV